MGRIAGRAATSNSSGRQVAKRKRVTFIASAKGGDDLVRSSWVESVILIFAKVEIFAIDKNQ